MIKFLPGQLGRGGVFFHDFSAFLFGKELDLHGSCHIIPVLTLFKVSFMRLSLIQLYQLKISPILKTLGDF